MDSARSGAVVQFACIASCTVWTLLVGSWVGNAIYHRKERPIMLHRVILQTLTVRWVLAWCTLAQQALYSFGLQDSQVLALQVIRVGITFVFACYLLAILLLVAKGWSVIVYRLPPAEMRTFYGLAFALFCVVLLMAIDTGFYVVALVFFDLLLIRVVFVNAEESIRWLEDAAHRANIQNDPMLFTVAHSKLRLLRTPKYLVIFYTVGYLLAEVMSFFLYANEPIVRYLFSEIIVVPVMLIVCFRFRLQDFSAFYPHAAGRAARGSTTSVLGSAAADAAAALEAEQALLGTFKLADLKQIGNAPASYVLAVTMPDANSDDDDDAGALRPINKRPVMLAMPGYSVDALPDYDSDSSDGGSDNDGRGGEGFAGLPRRPGQPRRGPRWPARHPRRISGNVRVPLPAAGAATATAPTTVAAAPPPPDLAPPPPIRWYASNAPGDDRADDDVNQLAMTWISGANLVRTTTRDNTYYILGRMLQPM